MKKLLSLVCVLLVGWLGAASASAAEPAEPAAIVVDAVIVRPACFVATAVGSVFFVISLPFAAASRSVHRSADALVVSPAKATFTRPLGDLDSLNTY